jgi:2-methylisocitrate lyase-like PEP mutase family enzyme
MTGLDEARAKRLKFREILARKKMTVMPGGFSPLYAMLAEEAGFECFFLPGSQLSAFLYGVPDNGIFGLRDLVDHARHMAARASIPIFIDADTGFGNAVNVHFTVQECVRAGIAGLQIEDQEAPKKSSTNAGRRCIPQDEAVGKIRAAVAARNEIDPSFVICARVDSLGAEGGGFDDALARSIAYIKEGGADFIWLNSVESRDQLRQACAEIPAPVLTIWGGNEAPPSLAEYEALGLRIALYPVVAATSGLQGAWEMLNDLRERGSKALADWNARAAKNPWGRPKTGKLLGADQIREIERLYLPAALQRDYDATWGHRTDFTKVSTAAAKKPAKKKASRSKPAKARKPSRTAKARRRKR